MTGLRLLTRKTRSHIPQLMGLMLLLMVGVCFFITLFTIVQRYEETAEQYFVDNAYADVTFYGAFDDESVKTISEQQGTILAGGRVVRDFRVGDMVFRAISLTDGLNTPYIYDGRMPEIDNECVLLRRNAVAMGLSIGDTITLGKTAMTITGLAASPEYIYMVQNERTMMAQPDHFAAVYVTKGFYPAGYNEIIAITDSRFSVDMASEAIGAFQTILRDDQLNHSLYRSDLEEISSFAYIFPFIFAVLIAVVIYVMLSRAIQKDRKQIGILKALGMPDGKIIRIYLSQFCIAALIGGLLGCFLATLVSDIIIGIFSSMFEVPTLSFSFYPYLWAGAIVTAVTLCAVSGLIALLSILPLLPAHAMRPRVPKGGRRLSIERANFLWKRFSFNTRYALKNSLRNKGRFFAVVLGMCGSCALLVFSLGFYNSIGNTQDQYFNGFANYDVIISFDPLPLASRHPAMEQVDSGYKALVMPARINGENYTLAVVEQGFDMVNIPFQELQNGIILPDYFARQWNVKTGDTFEMNGYTAAISAITPQYLGLTLYTSFNYINTITDELPPVYNAVYARSGDITGLTSFLEDRNIDFATIDDDSTSFHSIMKSMSVLIWFMIACSVVLGFTVLYSVGLINLSAREYEYMFMGVMGYPHKAIMSAHIKETLIQLVIAVPLGLLAGNLLLESVKGEFSGSSFVISSTIFPLSYVMSALAVICVSAVMSTVTSRHINKLDIVEGLKARDE